MLTARHNFCTPKPMLLTIITIHPASKHEAKVLDVLNSVRRMNAVNANCEDCRLSVEIGERRTVFYMERWLTQEGLCRHLRSPLYRQILEAIELSRIPPTFEFFEVKELGGLRLVEQARYLIPLTGNKTTANTIDHHDHLTSKSRLGEKNKAYQKENE